MKIDKDKFNELKQLDRIEFRQKLDKIENIGSSMIHWIYHILTMSIVFFIGAVISKEYILTMLFVYSFAFVLFLLLVEVISQLVYVLIRFKNKNDLNEEYFSVEVKK